MDIRIAELASLNARWRQISPERWCVFLAVFHHRRPIRKTPRHNNKEKKQKNELSFLLDGKLAKENQKEKERKKKTKRDPITKICSSGRKVERRR